MAADYCAVLREHGVPIPALAEDDLRHRYEALAALHAMKRLGRVRRADVGASLLSLATARLQTAHYRGPLAYGRRSVFQLTGMRDLQPASGSLAAISNDNHADVEQP